MTEQDIPALALAWHRSGRGAVIATVVETWGSAPRPVGSQIVIDASGAMEGSVSGGCVEGAVITEAIDSLDDGAARLLTFGVSDDDAFAVGLACGGQIRVLVEPVGSVMPEDLLVDLVNARAARRPIAYVAALQGPSRRLATPVDMPEAFIDARSYVSPDGAEFVAVHTPPLRMIVVGAVHIAQHLVPMAQACGFDPVVVDPRPVFGSEARFKGCRIVDDWPDEALGQLALDARTAVVTLTHDSKLDDPAIRAALGSDVFYLGCLGSTRTHAKRVERLKQAGFAQADIERIHGPVGLNIGAKSPAEIALSIMAQITQVLRQS